MNAKVLFNHGAVRTVAVVMIAVMLVGSFALIGPISAATVNVTTGDVQVTDNTQKVYAEITNLNTTTSASTTVDFFAYDVDGNEVTNKTGVSVSVAADTTITESLGFNYSQSIDHVNVSVDVDDTTVGAAEIETTLDSYEEFHNQNSTLTADTGSVYLEVENNGTVNATVEADFVAYDGNGTEVSAVRDHTFIVENGATVIEQPGLDLSADNLDHVVISANYDNATTGDLIASSGTFEQTEGGGAGFDFGSMSMMEYGIIALVAVVGYLFLKEDSQ